MAVSRLVCFFVFFFRILLDPLLSFLPNPVFLSSIRPDVFFLANPDPVFCPPCPTGFFCDRILCSCPCPTLFFLNLCFFRIPGRTPSFFPNPVAVVSDPITSPRIRKINKYHHFSLYVLIVSYAEPLNRFNFLNPFYTESCHLLVLPMYDEEHNTNTFLCVFIKQ